MRPWPGSCVLWLLARLGRWGPWQRSGRQDYFWACGLLLSLWGERSAPRTWMTSALEVALRWSSSRFPSLLPAPVPPGTGVAGSKPRARSRERAAGGLLMQGHFQSVGDRGGNQKDRAGRRRSSGDPEQMGCKTPAARMMSREVGENRALWGASCRLRPRTAPLSPQRHSPARTQGWAVPA